MGWLRDLMAEAGPAVGTYGKLARLALAHPDWPEDTRPKARSLAALFSKFDRDQELEWLADRPAVCHVLAEVLGTSAATFGRDFHAAVEVADDTGARLRLDDVPFARVLDLRTEPLPPGIPDLVLQPPRWERVLWRAPSGAGRSMVGRWLEARGLAAYIQARSLSDVASHMAQSGPLFVELMTEADVVAALRADVRRPVCIAGPLGRRPNHPTELTVVESPATSSFVGALVDWLEPRLPADGQFDAPVAVDLLGRWTDAGLCPTLGDLLGLAGLIDEFGAEDVRRRAPSDLAERYVSRKLRALRHPGGEAPAWHADAVDILVSMFKNSLTDAKMSWEAPRPLAAWTELVPPELRRTIDPDWLRLTMKAHTTSATMKELERALAHLPPGGFQVARAFESAAILRRVTRSGESTVGPRWLRTWLGERASRELAAASPFEWGEAMLEPDLAGNVFERVTERAQRDADGLVEDLLELEGQSSPAFAAATECVARAVGLEMLAGDLEAPENLASLWDAAVESLVDLDGVPNPRVGMGSADARLGLGAFHLAMLAISEGLPGGQGRRHALLRPWLLPPKPGALDGIYESIGVALTDESFQRRFAGPAAALVGRVPTAGTARPMEHRHVMERAAALVSSFLSGSVQWDDATLTLTDARAARALPTVASAAGASWRLFSEVLFEAWAASRYEGAAVLASAASSCPTLWSEAPVGVVEAAATQGALAAELVPWAALGPELWAALVRVYGEAVPEDAWRRAGGDAIARLVAAAPPAGSSARGLWRAQPDAFIHGLRERITTDPVSAARCLEEADPAAVAMALEVLHAPLQALRDVRPFARFLHRAVAERVRGWRDAYDLLAGIEIGSGRGRSHAP